MHLHSDLDLFYALLGELEERIGGRRRLGESHGGMEWPERGVYFFFEAGECRTHSPDTARVVRVGTHAMTTRSGMTLWKRLNQHRGTRNPDGGNHRGSIFRFLVGQALMSQGSLSMSNTWGRRAVAPRQVRLIERPIEQKVSDYLGAMTLVFLPVSDVLGPQWPWDVIERNSVALLSNFSNPTPDQPSANWLGRHSNRDRVRHSGLWNNNYVDNAYDPGFLRLFEDLIEQIPVSQALSWHEPCRSGSMR